MIIAIDGPSASGKGYIAKRIALKFDLDFYATGEIVRLFAYLNEDKQYKEEEFNKEKVVEYFKTGKLEYYWDKNDVQSKILFQGKDITSCLYNSFISAQASIYMKNRPHEILDVLREVGKIILHNKNGFVIEGRQTTSILFPDANYRFYLDADVKERARRRKIDFDKRNEETTLEKQIQELEERDRRDSTRKIGPLEYVKGVTKIDCTNMTKEECLEYFISLIK